jgi:nitrogen fixation/metabolism regulation signal transduction histidine kinase
MPFNWRKDFRITISLRLLLILLNLLVISWLTTRKPLLVFSLIGLCALLLVQIVLLFQSLQKVYRQLEDFFTSLRYQDTTRQALPVFYQGKKLAQLWHEIQTDIQQLRERNESLLHYYSLLLEKVPVPLLRIHNDQLELINTAARQLFQRNQIFNILELRQFGEEFVQSLVAIKPGEQRQVSLQVAQQSLSLAVTATTIQLPEGLSKIISLQVIQQELDRQQISSWQKLMQVLSHEIMNSMTPINSLSNTAQNLLNDYERAPAADLLMDTKAALATVSRRSEHLMAFLGAYRTVTQPLRLVLHLYSLDSLLRNLESLFSAQLCSASISLDIDVIPQDLLIQTDEAQFEHMLINLVKNAVESLRDCSQLEKRIRLHAYIGPIGEVILDIEDNGPKIPAGKHEQIFVPFYTSKRTGTGVGLFVVQQVMHAHGGSVKCIARASGNCFRLVFAPKINTV